MKNVVSLIWSHDCKWTWQNSHICRFLELRQVREFFEFPLFGVYYQEFIRKNKNTEKVAKWLFIWKTHRSTCSASSTKLIVSSNFLNFFLWSQFFFSLTKQNFPFPVAHCSKGANQERQKRKKEKFEKKSIFEKMLTEGK